ncbi:MAG TPA: aquaporin [Candidatus Babeliales bacterium]|nr:aquaporin [Candidatus Babeliales bacterium]
MKQYAVEMVGTFFLALTIAISLTITGNVLAIGLMLMAMIYMANHVSGAHFNPAVSTSVWLRGAMSLKELCGYKIAQVSGAALASCLFYIMTSSFFILSSEGLWLVGFIRELLLTFVFCIVILTVATTTIYKASHVVGLIIGFTLVALASLTGTVNPALGAVSALGNVYNGDMMAAWLNVVVYVFGPLVGAFVAAMWFKYLNPREV